MSTLDVPQISTTSRARVILGLMVILFGLMALLDRIGGAFGVRLDVHLWPFILIFLGLARFVDEPVGHRISRNGVWLILVGVWGLINEYRILGLHYGSSWPVLVIFAGLMIVWRALESPEAPRPAREQ